MNSLVLAPFSKEALASLKSIGEVQYEPWTVTQELKDSESLRDRVIREKIGILILEADFLFEEFFENISHLSIVGVCRSAVNHVDLESATEHGIVVVNTPGRNAQAVAELTVGLMYSLARHIPQANNYVKAGKWADPVEAYSIYNGRELSGSTLGVIGFGAIGQNVAKICSALGMRVIVYDPYFHNPGHKNSKVTFVTLEKLIQTSDFVTVHIPENSESVGLLNREIMSTIREHAYLINVSSSAVMDQSAVFNMLEEGRLAGAAMDVHDTHPIIPGNQFIKADNMILTPHIGGATRETVTRHSKMILKDIHRFLKGQRPINLANSAVWERHAR